MERRKAEANQKDYEIFKEMHEKFGYAEFNSEEEHIREPIVKSYEKYVQYANYEWIYFAIEQEKVIGYAIVMIVEDEETGEVYFKIAEIHIIKEMQHKGYGKQFVSLVKDLAREEGLKRIELESATMATDRFWSNCRFRSCNASDIYECYV